MTTERVVRLVFLTLVFFSAFSANAASKNQIDNPGFESGYTHPPYFYWPMATKVSVDTSEKAEGAQSLLVKVPTVDPAILHEPHVDVKEGLSVKKGAAYTFSIWMKAKKERWVRLEARDEEKPMWAFSEHTVGPTWKEYKLEFVSPETNNKDFFLLIELGKDAVDTWLDKLSFVEK